MAPLYSQEQSLNPFIDTIIHFKELLLRFSPRRSTHQNNVVIMPNDPIPTNSRLSARYRFIPIWDLLLVLCFTEILWSNKIFLTTTAKEPPSHLSPHEIIPSFFFLECGRQWIISNSFLIQPASCFSVLSSYLVKPAIDWCDTRMDCMTTLPYLDKYIIMWLPGGSEAKKSGAPTFDQRKVSSNWLSHPTLIGWSFGVIYVQR